MIAIFASWAQFFSFLLGQICYSAGLLFYSTNFLILRKASVGAITFLFFILLAAAIKIVLILSLTYLSHLMFVGMSWLFFILGLILAVKTMFIIFVPNQK
jgi:hypothetical protein|tara:strand:+ start:433 stop:732 length:300 start_codon:yes stop_codon:yes gene_type:complete